MTSTYIKKKLQTLAIAVIVASLATGFAGIYNAYALEQTIQALNLDDNQ